MVSKKTLAFALFVMVVLAGLLTACAQAPAAVERSSRSRWCRPSSSRRRSP